MVAQNVSLDKCHFVLCNTRPAVFAQLIIFACLAFRAAQRGLGLFTSVKKLSVDTCIITVGIMINILSSIAFSLS